MIPEAQHPKTRFPQCCIAGLVCSAVRLLGMLATVYLDHHFLLEANEVDNVPAQGDLPSKFPFHTSSS